MPDWTSTLAAIANLATSIAVAITFWQLVAERRRASRQRHFDVYNELNSQYVEYLRDCMAHPEVDGFDIPLAAPRAPEGGRRSDIDLFIEMESSKRPSDRAIDVLRLFGLRHWSMDVLVYTPEEVRASRGKPGSLVASIEAEGRVLHERACPRPRPGRHSRRE